jgi:hypothetical protein
MGLATHRAEGTSGARLGRSDPKVPGLEPGSLKGIQVNVDDVGVVQPSLRERGVEVSEIQDYPVIARA